MKNGSMFFTMPSMENSLAALLPSPTHTVQNYSRPESNLPVSSDPGPVIPFMSWIVTAFGVITMFGGRSLEIRFPALAGHGLNRDILNLVVCGIHLAT